MRVERTQTLPESECPRGEHWRNRVEFDDDFGLTMVAEEKVTSASPRAQVLEATTLELTEESVRWLCSTLGEIVKQWDERIVRAGGLKPLKLFAQPTNDVPHHEALKIVAVAARDAHDVFMEDDSTPEDVAATMEPLGAALARLKRAEGRVIPMGNGKPSADDFDEEDEP